MCFLLYCLEAETDVKCCAMCGVWNFKLSPSVGTSKHCCSVFRLSWFSVSVNAKERWFALTCSFTL